MPKTITAVPMELPKFLATDSRHGERILWPVAKMPDHAACQPTRSGYVPFLRFKTENPKAPKYFFLRLALATDFKFSKISLGIQSFTPRFGAQTTT